jgi:uncharacterized protein YbjT (DUF2867 family)
MIKPKILVTAAAGKTGSATAVQLLKQGYPVRAMVQREDRRSQALRAAGAEVVVGSLEDWIDLQSALAGIQRAYYCPPLVPGALRRATLFAAAAREAGLEVLVVLSQWLADPRHPAIHAREKWLSDKMFGWTPKLDVITVNPGFFADNYLFALEPITQFGLMAMPLGQGLNAPPSNEDVARVVVGALVHPAAHLGRSYRPTGPKLLAPDEIARTIGKVLARPVKYQDAPPALFFRGARSLGVSDFVIEELSWFLQDYQRGSFALGAPTGAVQEVGHAEPEDFERIVRRYVHAYPFANRSATSLARAIGNLVKVLLVSTPSPPRIARALELPGLHHPSLAADSLEWRATHVA